MEKFEELFYILGVVFPNRVRVMLLNGKLSGMAGRFDIELLQRMGESIEAGCPEHSKFSEAWDVYDGIVATRHIVAVPAHSNFVVRFLHFPHNEKDDCRILALAAGPFEAIKQLSHDNLVPSPLTLRELHTVLDLAAGHSLHEISKDRQLSIHTVRNQVKSSMRATGTHSQAHLISAIRDWIL